MQVVRNSSCELESIIVRSAFPVPEEQKSRKSAEQWASYNSKSLSKSKFDIIYARNEPIFGARVIGYDERGHGGRAIKVILHVEGQNIIVDMREEEFYPELVINGVRPGGFISGPFAWVINGGGHMHLIRCNSKQWHDALVNLAMISNKSSIKSSDLKIGNVYSTSRNENYLLYLGRAYDPFNDNKKSWIFIDHNYRIEKTPANLEASYTKSLIGAFEYTPSYKATVQSHSYFILKSSCPKFSYDHGPFNMNNIAKDFIDDPSNIESISEKIQEKVNKAYEDYRYAIECALVSEGSSDTSGVSTARHVDNPTWSPRS